MIQPRGAKQKAQRNRPHGGRGKRFLQGLAGIALARQHDLVHRKHKQHLAQIHHGKGGNLLPREQDSKQSIAQHAGLKTRRDIRRKPAVNLQALTQHKAQKTAPRSTPRTWSAARRRSSGNTPSWQKR